MSTDNSLKTLTAGDFRLHLGTVFLMTGGPYGSSSEAGVGAELAEVIEHPADPSGRYRNPFSVMFHGPLQPVLRQGIHHVEHEHLGTLDLFIVPVGPDEPADPGQAPSRMRYEVVFG